MVLPSLITRQVQDFKILDSTTESTGFASDLSVKFSVGNAGLCICILGLAWGAS